MQLKLTNSINNCKFSLVQDHDVLTTFFYNIFIILLIRIVKIDQSQTIIIVKKL